MLPEGRKQTRDPQRLLVEISAVRDPRLVELVSAENLSPRGAQIKTARSWELGSHVDLKSHSGELRARARIVYCHPLGPKSFVVGLDFLQTNEGDIPTELGFPKKQH